MARRIGKSVLHVRVRRDAYPDLLGMFDVPVLSRKASSDVCARPVPETDTGGLVEDTKAFG